MLRIPERIELANLPTRIEKLSKLSEELGGPEIYIKRDDYTGTELSGNKVRKLEFALKQALEMGCDYVITCGGVQSNHARATAVAAVKLGMGTCLVLRGNDGLAVDGNLFIDKLLGAEVRFISGSDYKHKRMEIMEAIKKEAELKGFKPYIIPEGASNGIGTFGYYHAMEEIIEQEKELRIKFDAIFVAIGSGGTLGGLVLGKKALKHSADIYGVNVCDDADYFKGRVCDILDKANNYIDVKYEFNKDEINIIDGYVGKGYALSRPEEIEFIRGIARLEGVILDPVYTGKAMYGLVEEIRKGRFKEYKNILFIHTGGLFGLFPSRDLF